MKKLNTNSEYNVFGNEHLVKSGPLSSISSKEKGKSYKGINVLNQHLMLCKVDNGLIKGSENAKNDRLLLSFGENRSAYFIEIKGSDIKKGSLQITNSINTLHEKLDGFKIYARIICSRVDNRDLNHQSVIKLKRKSKNRLVIKQLRLVEDLK